MKHKELNLEVSTEDVLHFFFCFCNSLPKGDEDALGDALGHRNKYKRNKENCILKKKS